MIRVSTQWPAVRARSIDLGASTYELLEAVGIVRRAGMPGSFALMPLGAVIRDKMEQLIKSAFVSQGFLVFSLPALQSRALWQSSGRWDVYAEDGSLFRVQGRGNDDVACLAPTSEEMTVSIVAQDLKSYRDLPIRLYQTGINFRNELSPRGGLLRAREFEMAECYTFDVAPEGMADAIDALNAGCHDALRQIGIPDVQAVSADGGDITKAPSTEHVVISGIGQSDFLSCDICGYQADAAVAFGSFVKSDSVGHDGATVAKVLAFRCGDRDRESTVTVVIRGDLNVSPRKLASITGASWVRLLTAQEFAEAFGLEFHTLNPAAALAGSETILFDTSVANLRDFTIADPKSSDGLRHGVNWGREPVLGGIVPGDGVVTHEARAGLWCGSCGQATLSAHRSVELGHVFELGQRYSEPMGLRFLDRQGNFAAPFMACSGIGFGRCLQVLAHLRRDDRGLSWPAQVAPAQVHVLSAGVGKPAEARALDIAAKLTDAGLEVLLDDRNVSVGERFRYAWALGVPCQLAVPSKDDASVELTDRASRVSEVVPTATALSRLVAGLPAPGRQ